MKIAILGYGKEGKSAANFLRAKYPDAELTTFSDFDSTTLDLADYDLVSRSPSVPPHWLVAAGAKQITSNTKLFFEHCALPIIGVTGTKGKGTTSSLITALLHHLGKRPALIGNIGTPALDVLDHIQDYDVVVYEMSSFQLWDLHTSPHIAVILGIAPDHLNVHTDFTDYLTAKGNIARHQTASDAVIYNSNNHETTTLATLSPAAHYPYPPTLDAAAETLLNHLLEQLAIPGPHNRENATLALMAVAAFMNQDLPLFLTEHHDAISQAFSGFKGLPHRLEFIKELNHVRYYDDNFATNPASTKVALAAFPDSPLVLIAGGRDKTDYADLPELCQILNATKNLQKIVLIGESGAQLSKILPPERTMLAKSLSEAVALARTAAEALATPTQPAVLLMSPAAASFDMFKDVYDRGAQFQQLVKDLA